MFGVLPPGVRISEGFSEFQESTLLTPSPIPCWPATLGNLAASVIRSEVQGSRGPGERSKVLVVTPGAGRVSLELVRSCGELELTHVSPALVDMADLLASGNLRWEQPVEGRISEEREFRLADTETREALLSDKNNSVEWIRARLGGWLSLKCSFTSVFCLR